MGGDAATPAWLFGCDTYLAVALTWLPRDDGNNGDEGDGDVDGDDYDGLFPFIAENVAKR